MFAVILLKDSENCVRTPCVCVDPEDENANRPAIYEDICDALDVMEYYNVTFHGGVNENGPFYGVSEVHPGSIFETKIRLKTDWKGSA